MIDVDKVSARARLLGKVAAQGGHPLTACPYDPKGDPIQRVSAAAWVRSFLHWRPQVAAAIHHGRDTDDGPA